MTMLLVGACLWALVLLLAVGAARAAAQGDESL
jgi:hypothetical protein